MLLLGISLLLGLLRVALGWRLLLLRVALGWCLLLLGLLGHWGLLLLYRLAVLVHLGGCCRGRSRGRCAANRAVQ